MTFATNPSIVGLFQTNAVRRLWLSFFTGSLVLALTISWAKQTLDREEAQMRRLTDVILATEGDIGQLRELHEKPAYRSTSLFWTLYLKSLLMADQSDHRIQHAIAEGLLNTRGWEFIRLVENVEPYVMGYTAQQISAYQRLILDFKDPALEFHPSFVVHWKTCIDSFAHRYDGYAGRLLYYRDVLRWKDASLCPGLKEKALAVQNQHYQ